MTDVYDPLNNHTQTIYDLVGEIKYATTPKGFTNGVNNNQYTTTYTRPASLASETIVDPRGEQETANFDGQGRRTSFVDKRGITDTYHYDLFSRVTSVVFNSNGKAGYPQRTVGVSPYDALDRPTTITDSLGASLSYSYDSLNHVLAESPSGRPTVSYGYDYNGRLISMQPPPVKGTTRPALNYGYDCGDELNEITNDGSSVPSCSPSTYIPDGYYKTPYAQVVLDYDADGMLSWRYVNGAFIWFSNRDPDERPTVIQYQPNDFSIVYGNLTYAYDADGRLTDKGGSFATTSTPAQIAASYGLTDQISTWKIGNGTNYSANIDAASNITTDPANLLTYTWDARNQLSAVSGGIGNLRCARTASDFGIVL